MGRGLFGMPKARLLSQRLGPALQLEKPIETLVCMTTKEADKVLHHLAAAYARFAAGQKDMTKGRQS